MKDTINHIKCEDIEYPLCFNLNVIEKIQNKYGSYEKWGEMTDGKSGSEVNIGAFKFGVLEMINEGIDIENENSKNQRNFITDKQVGRIMTKVGMEHLLQKAQETVIESTKNDYDEEKNV